MLFRICIGPRRLMPPTSAPGFRMEKAIVGVAHRVLFGALSFAAQEEQAFNGEITDRMCSGVARPHDASPFRNYVHDVVDQRTMESLWGDSRSGELVRGQRDERLDR
jgi:hypothetical protein